MRPHASSAPLAVAVVGTGWMGAFHARTLAERLPQFELRALVDPNHDQAAALARELGVDRVLADAEELWDDTSVAAVVIASPPRTHPDLIIAAARSGKAVFCEKPVALSTSELERVIPVVAECSTLVHVGFNRRFSSDFSHGRESVVRGEIGTPLQLRSLTRDPDVLEPRKIKTNAIFLETLIHDFDLLNWLQPGARATEVSVLADALIRPDWKNRGLLDTALVTIRYSNGAMAVAEACLQTTYGYDVRAEVLGTAGMLTVGGPQLPGLDLYTRPGLSRPTVRKNIELFAEAYREELVAFHRAVSGSGQQGEDPRVATIHDALSALDVAEAAIASYGEGGAPAHPVRVTQRP